MGECGICFQKCQQFHEWECGQSAFCQACSEKWVSDSISANKIPNCIFGCQNHEVSLEFVKQLLENHPNLMQKSEILYIENQIPVSDRIYCFKCSFPYLKQAPEVLNCNKCKAKTCIKCSMPWHKKHECEEMDSDTKSTIEHAGFQMCTCGLIIERSDFCNKITCSCGRTFCYKCNKDYENSTTKMCECVVYDDNIMFIMYAERLFHIVADPHIAQPKNPLIDGLYNKSITNFVNMVSTYKNKMSDDRERSNVMKLRNHIFLSLINLSSYEVGMQPFASININSLKDVEAVIVQYRHSRSETSIMRQQLLTTYNELIETKRQLHELTNQQQANKKTKV